MSNPIVPQLQLAAQSDLVMLTAIMLRAPQAKSASSPELWWRSPLADLRDLLRIGFGSEADSAITPEQASSFPHLNQALLPSLSDALEELLHIANTMDFDRCKDEYWRLFDTVQACPINQASYVRRDKGTILGDLAGFYSAFGWRVHPDHGERPDHLVIQLEFVGLLFAMAASAESPEQRDVAQDALAQFARCHMHDWLPSVCMQMIDTTQASYFGAFAQWLTVFWIQLTTLHRWPVDPVATRRVEPNLDPEDPYECGALDLVQLNAS